MAGNKRADDTMIKKRFFTLLFAAFFISGCGGGGGNSSLPTTGNSPSNVVSFTGVVYADELLANAALQIKCPNGVTGNGNTNSVGAYQIEIQNPQYPCIIKASGGVAGGRSNNENIYSIALQNSNIVVSLITNYGLLTNSVDLDDDFANPDFSKYNSVYLTQAINNLDYRLSMAGYLKSLSNFSTNSLFEKEIIKNFSKSIYYKSLRSPSFLNAISQSTPTAAADISYNQYYSNFNFRINSIGDLYWARAYGVQKDSLIIDWIVYPKHINDSDSIAMPELYDLIVPAVEQNEGGQLDSWYEPPPTAKLFINNIVSAEYTFLVSTISRAWYP